MALRPLVKQFLRSTTSLNSSTFRLIASAQIKSRGLEQKIELNDDHLRLINYHTKVTGSGNGVKLKINYNWLRDHCRCFKCYNTATHQRNFDILDLDDHLVPKQANIVENEEPRLEVTWPDGHNSNYSLQELFNTWRQHDGSGRLQPANGRIQKSAKLSRVLWDAQTIQQIGVDNMSVPFDQVMTGEEGLRKLYTNILTYGIAFVTDTPVSATANETESLCKKVGLIEETCFGKFWVFSAENMQHADTAYTNLGLGPHTDNTYYRNTPGAQVFHCLEAGKGGETVLVDGFKSVKTLQEQHPSAFRLLSSLRIPHEFIENGVHLLSEETVVKVHPVTGKFEQLRFNPYDRAPLTNLNQQQTADFYEAYRILAMELRRPENTFWMKLHPGTTIFMDNWRVLHGRAAFTGKRVMSGCYLSRDDMISKARVFNLI